MFVKQIQLCHIREIMRPLHITYRTGPQHRRIVWRGHRFTGCCLAYLLSFPWNSGAKLIQQVEVKNQKTCGSTSQQHITCHFEEGSKLNSPLSIETSLNSPNSNEPLYRVANQEDNNRLEKQMDRNIVKFREGRMPFLCLEWEKHEWHRLRSNWLYNCVAEDKLQVLMAKPGTSHWCAHSQGQVYTALYWEDCRQQVKKTNYSSLFTPVRLHLK